jgi:nucleotide-binding universal stress UspA family protein
MLGWHEICFFFRSFRKSNVEGDCMHLPNYTENSAHHTGNSAQDRNAVCIERVLVVIDADLLAAPSPLHSVLIQRALWLGRNTGATLELFHVRSDQPVFTRLRNSAEERVNKRTEQIDEAATEVAELAVNMAAESGLVVEHETCWAENEVAAILQKTSESRADLLLKASSNPGYLIGLLERPDWTLLRQSPAHVWFVGEKAEAPQHLLAATGDEASVDSGSAIIDDKAVCSFTSALADACQLRTSILQATPRDALPELAERLDADAVLMGASNLSRLERLFRRVSAEPVLERTNGDVIFLRPDALPEKTPDAVGTLVHGLPAVDLERALADPDIVFDHSPEKLAAEDRLSITMRRRLLKLWEHDLRAALTEEDEGGITARSPAELLPAIVRAKSRLAAEETPRHRAILED